MVECLPQVVLPLVQPAQRQAGLTQDAAGLVGDGHTGLLDQGQCLMPQVQRLLEAALLLPDLAAMQQGVDQAVVILAGAIAALG